MDDLSAIKQERRAMKPTQAIWIKNPQGHSGRRAGGGIVVQEGRIVELVSPGATPATDATVFDASSHVVLPGLINTHHHFYQTLTRAVPAAMDRELFPWLQALYPIWAGITPETLELGGHRGDVRAHAVRLHHHDRSPLSLSGRGLEEAVDIEVAVARRLGLRALMTRGSMNLSQRDGGLPPDSVVQDEDTILADCERVVAQYHERG